MMRASAVTVVLLSFAALTGCSAEPTGAPAAAAATRPAGMTVDCRDVAGDACTMVAAEYGGGVGANGVMELTMRCVAQTCTTTNGKVEIGLLNASGQRMSHGYDWGADQENAALAPVVPVAAQLPAPVCLGVVGARCLEMARAGDIPMGAPRVTVITVRCTKGSCTDGAGEGETTITFEDGTRSIVGW